MISKKLDQLADVLMEKETNPNIDKEVIIYGLSSAIEHGISIITTIIFGLLFGLTLESIAFLIAFSFIRTYAGGYHCQKAVNCYLMSSGVILFVLGMVKFTPKEHMIILAVAMLLVSVPSILRLAPLGTTSKPLNQDERKYYRKKTVIHLGFEVTVIPFLFYVELYSFAYIVCMGIMVSAGLLFLQK